MPSTREIIRVNITWVEPGELSSMSDICAEHPCRRSTIPYYPGYSEDEDEGQEFYKSADAPPKQKRWRLDMHELLSHVTSWPVYGDAGDSRHTYHIHDYYQVSDPPIEMLVPVVLFDFDLTPSRESWLAYLVESEGLEGVFNRDLAALENAGRWCWHRNHATDYGRYGVSTTFHGLWGIQVGRGEDPDVDWGFEGLVDPHSVNGIPIEAQTKPHRGATMQNLSML